MLDEKVKSPGGILEKSLPGRKLNVVLTVYNDAKELNVRVWDGGTVVASGPGVAGIICQQEALPIQFPNQLEMGRFAVKYLQKLFSVFEKSRERITNNYHQIGRIGACVHAHFRFWPENLQFNASFYRDGELLPQASGPDVPLKLNESKEDTIDLAHHILQMIYKGLTNEQPGTRAPTLGGFIGAFPRERLKSQVISREVNEERRERDRKTDALWREAQQKKSKAAKNN